MFVIKGNQPTHFDVDDTLVMWHSAQPGDPRAIPIKCPTTRCKRIIEEVDPLSGEAKELELEFEAGDWTEWVVPHRKHIEALKAHKLRGHTVVVWSAGGWEWAEAVVRALGLEKYVDVVQEKPRWCYDDLPPNEYMPKSQYIKDE